MLELLVFSFKMPTRSKKEKKKKKKKKKFNLFLIYLSNH